MWYSVLGDTRRPRPNGKTEKIEAVNPYLVRIRFKEPFPDFLEQIIPGGITLGWITPKKYIEKVGEAEYKKRPVGAGPYKVIEFVPGVKLVVEAFEEYWRKVPNIKRMEFFIVSEPATRVAMVRRGEVDIATLMQGIFYNDVKKDPNLRMLSPLSPAHHIAYMTSQWDPKSPWSDPRVRKAASLAIDRKTLADVHMPGSFPIGGLGLEADPLTVRFAPDPYSPEQAKKLLAEAGYPRGFQAGKYYPMEGGYWAFGEQIATYWKAVGISVEIVLLDRPAWFANRQAKKMSGAVFTEAQNAPTIGGRLAYLFGATSYGNYPDIQAMWEKYQEEVSLKIRRELITRIQELIHERTMWIPLVSNNSPAAIGPQVKGNPFKIQPPKSYPLWFTAPFEDIELEK
jgi:peptide/nickel transport system substrate-binding protein